MQAFFVWGERSALKDNGDVSSSGILLGCHC